MVTVTVVTLSLINRYRRYFARNEESIDPDLESETELEDVPGVEVMALLMVNKNRGGLSGNHNEVILQNYDNR